MTRFKLFAVISIFLLLCSELRAANDPTGAGVNLLGQIAKAFAADTAVSNVKLSGTAQWYAGSLQDYGNATLVAASDGSSQMQLQMAKMGSRTESQTGVGPSMSCQWAGADAVPHVFGSSNCVRPIVWFLPAVALQQSSLLTILTASDLGIGADTYRHAQLQFAATALVPGSGSEAMQASTTNLALDPASFLPQVLAYRVSPDNGSPIAVPIEVHFSDYRLVNGAQLPFRIQRYLNGTLQLDVTVTSAEVN